MKVTEARKITDSLTRTSKMPGLSYSLPAWACQTGSKLRKVKTSPCYGCYALKNNYTGTQQLRKHSIEGWTLSTIRNGLKQWPHKLNVKNGLDGMTPATFNQSSICKKLLKCVSLHLIRSTGCPHKNVSICQPLKMFQKI